MVRSNCVGGFSGRSPAVTAADAVSRMPRTASGPGGPEQKRSNQSGGSTIRYARKESADEDKKEKVAAEIRDLRQSMWAGNIEVLHRVNQVLDKLDRDDVRSKPEGSLAYDGKHGSANGGRAPTDGSLLRDRRDGGNSNREVEDGEEEQVPEESDDGDDGANGEAESANNWWLN